MKITTNSTLLAKELRLLSKAIPAKPVLPVLANVLLDATDSLKLSITDLEIGIQTVCSATVETQGKVLLPAQKLLDIVSKFPNADVVLEELKNKVRITCAGFTSNLQTHRVEDFPLMPDAPYGMVLDTKELLAMVERVKYAVIASNAMVLNGALLKIVDGFVALIATDSKRVSITTTAGTGDTEAILPAKLLGMLSILNDEGTQFSQTEKHLFFVSGTRVLISRKLDGKFPNYERIIPQDQPISVVVNRKALSEALKRVLVLSDDELVNLDLEQTIKVSVTSKDGDAAEDVSIHIESAKTGYPLKLALFGNHVVEFLDAAGHESVTLKARDDKSPITLHDGDNFMNVVMVVRR